MPSGYAVNAYVYGYIDCQSVSRLLDINQRGKDSLHVDSDFGFAATLTVLYFY